MIDCLSSPSWIGPQMDFLIYLQGFRTGNLEHFDKFFLSVTVLGEYWVPTLICAIAYWCIDFRAGLYLFSLESMNILLAHFFKMVACVYRPWVLDSRIHPSKLAVPYAKGYSFPSGHSAMSSSIFGGLAFLFRKNKLLATLFVGVFLLVGFSRLWLGVHSPQDVVVGLMTGIILVFVMNFIINWAEKDKNRYLYLIVLIDILAVMVIIYIRYFNTYRIDYVSGEMLVNPKKLIYVTEVVYAYALGILNGSFLCRRFFPFNPSEVSLKRRIVRGIIGSIALILMLKFILEPILMNIVSIKFALIMLFLVGISITLIYPIIFTTVKNNFIKD